MKKQKRVVLDLTRLMGYRLGKTEAIQQRIGSKVGSKTGSKLAS